MTNISKKTAQRMTKAALMQVLNTLDECNCDPLKELAKIAMDPVIDLDTRVSVLKDLTNYVHPKRRSIDIQSAEGSEGLIVNIKSFSDKMAQETVDPEKMKEMLEEDYSE